MIKKYFAMSIIAASVAVAGCSSDDDPEAVVDPVTPPVTVPAADATNDSSAFDVVANSPNHTTLLAAINAAGLADTLDNPASTFTIFAPTDDAFAALDAATPGSVDALVADTAALTRVLQYHVVGSALTGTAISEGVTSAAADAPFTAASLLTDADDGNLTFTNPAEGLSVNGVVVAAPDLAPMGDGATGVVHSIGTVLSAPAATVVAPVDPGPVDPGNGEGGVPNDFGPIQTTLVGGGAHSIFLDNFATNYGIAKLEPAVDGAQTENDPWTVLAVSDAALAGADLNLGRYVQTGGALSAAELLAAGTFTPFGGGSFPVAGTVDALTIGGFAVTLVPGGEAGRSVTYTIDGAL